MPLGERRVKSTTSSSVATNTTVVSTGQAVTMATAADPTTNTRNVSRRTPGCIWK